MNTPHHWNADHLRLTFFSSSLWDIQIDSEFLGFFAAIAETVQTKPSAGQGKANGPWKDLLAEARVSTNRLDFLVQAAPTGDLEQDIISDPLGNLDLLIESGIRWAAEKETITRIALGVGGLIESSSEEDSLSKIQDLVRFVHIDPTKHKEFQVRFNSPRESESIASLQINRLTTWSSVEVTIGLITPNGPSSTLKKKYYCSCNIDINTATENTTPFTKNQGAALLTELQKTAKEILANGVD